MTRLNRLVTLFIFTCLSCWSTGATAQLEVHPYLGYVEAAALSRYVVGADVHIGSRRLAPLFGAVYGSRNKEISDGEVRFSRAWVPMGFAYRLRPADVSFNLVAHAAFVPGLTWTSSDDASLDESEVNYRVRGGLLLYLDFITLGADYYYGFTDGELEDTRSGTFILRLGGRF